MSRLAALVATLVLGTGLAACGSRGGGGGQPGPDGSASSGSASPSRVEVVKQVAGGRFNPSEIYAREAPGVVTVVSVLENTGLGLFGGKQKEEGVGSGFVVSGDGEIATNAHVVTSGTGASLKRAKEVYVQFGSGDRVPAKILGADPNADVALIKVDPAGLTLRPLRLGTSSGLVIGSPVAAIGSPFNEAQSLSVGIISQTNRTIDSLNSQQGGKGGFAISGAIQTDAAINHGNSGGPLLDQDGRVLGINSQIQSTGGGGEGVGFAVPIDTVKRSLAQLRTKGRADYAYLGVSTTPVFPELAKRFDLGSAHGAWVQDLTSDTPAAKAGLKGGGARNVRFQIGDYAPGGDVITKVNGKALREDSDLSSAIAALSPGDTATLEVYRGKDRREVKVELGSRPVSVPVKR